MFMDHHRSSRLDRLPPYLFAEFEKKRTALEKEGRDIINLGIGDPDTDPPKLLLDAMVSVLNDPLVHQYSPSQGTEEFRSGVADFFQRRYGVSLENREICLAVGSKELIAHAPMALTEPGDIVLVPEPGYPPYRSGAVFALAEPWVMKLRADRGFLPDLDAIPEEVAKKARILYLNYPNNPTGGVATLDFYREAVAFAKKYEITVISDEAYAELYYEEPPHSFLEVEGAKEVGVSVHSMTKTFSMAGWRIAWVCGNADVVETLRGFKANCDSGQFMGFQKATTAILRDGAEEMKRIRDMYRARRDAFVDGLQSTGWNIPRPNAGLYIWFPVPVEGMSSMDFAGKILEEASVIVLPGSGFGEAAEGFARAALTIPEDRIREAAERISKINW